jgi:hypothetical protein
MRQVEGALAERGYQRTGEVRTGSLTQGERESISLTLGAGLDFAIVGLCDNDCSDLDLRLYDQSGAEVDADIETDDSPVVELTPRSSGTYRVEIVMVSCSVSPCYYGLGVFSGATAPAEADPAGARYETGTLSVGEDTLSSGEYADVYSFAGLQGESVVIDLRSSDFDPYLILRTPDGRQEENDDHEGDASRSLLSLALPADGIYEVTVTTYRPGETGSYALQIDRQFATETAAGPRVERGSLSIGDDTLRTGEYVDVYDFDGRPGQHVRLDLTSDDFDTYLILKNPAGEQVENDDADRPGHSVVESELTELGPYRIMVTSYEAGESGAYELVLALESGGTQTGRSRDVVTLGMGANSTGELSPNDGQLETGEYRDIYVFDGSIGDNVAVEMSSTEFDTYIILLTPTGETIENDDDEGSTSRSRIDLTLRETGRYRLVATSYKVGATGSYEVALQPGTIQVGTETPSIARGEAGPPHQGQVFGVFAGISNYGGRMNDLAYTAEDAVRVRNAMIRGAGMPSANGVLLTDNDATSANLRRSIQSLATRVGPDDTFVLFFSGHGGRMPRIDFQPSDPDALDETLEFFDAGITDDEMREVLEAVPAGRIILLFDACFSGGFSKDVISAPGRMGLFSSEEDVTSSVAAKFRAGGYLALFVADAIGDHLADADGDGQLTAIELSQYVHERYRADVKSADPTQIVRTGGPQMGHQHLVVDRGSIGPYDVLLRW